MTTTKLSITIDSLPTADTRTTASEWQSYHSNQGGFNQYFESEIQTAPLQLRPPKIGFRLGDQIAIPPLPWSTFNSDKLGGANLI